MRNKWIPVLFLMCPALAVQAADSLTQSQLEAAFSRCAPAIAMLKYSSEITNPNTGETVKRDNNALALVVSPDGLLMAPGHIALEESRPFNLVAIIGQDDSEREFDAVLLQKPDDVNVTFLRVKSDSPLNLPYVRFSSEHNLRLGAPVAVFGMLGESLDHSRGLIPARVGAVLTEPRTTYCLSENIRFGFVSGPVVDNQGRFVGVVGLDLSRQEGGDLYVRSGHPLIYQAALFQKYIDSPPGESSAASAEDEAFLGVFTQPLTDDFATYWGLKPEGGLIVSTVMAASPAANAGLRPGDVITRFGDTPIRAKLDRDVLGFTKLVRDTGPNQTVSITFLRESEPQTVEATLGTRPTSARDAQEFEDTVFGLTVREITADLRIMLNLSDDVQGVIVRRVKSGSVAQLGKMRPGVIIMAFGDHPVSNLEEFKAAVAIVAEQKPKEVAVFARVGAATGFFRLEPRWANGR
jgi:serine protease Do